MAYLIYEGKLCAHTCIACDFSETCNSDEFQALEVFESTGLGDAYIREPLNETNCRNKCYLNREKS